MKTTVDITDSLLVAAKLTAVRQRTTLKALIEEGLRCVVPTSPPLQAFRLRDASVSGDGSQRWEHMTDDERTAAMYDA